MCGIAGVFDVSGCPVDRLEARLRRMNAVQRHRGPDGEGVWTSPSGCAGLGHVRLSVIDPEGGAQPMVDEEAGLTIVFNGEIYNFRELRAQLATRHAFSTRSDTEVILNAYRKWGAACVEHLRGMFSFAIWDERKRALLLARDRFGIKPLYTAWVGERFYFASEVKALLPFLPDVRTRLSRAPRLSHLPVLSAGKNALPRRSRGPAGDLVPGRRAGRACHDLLASAV